MRILEYTFTKGARMAQEVLREDKTHESVSVMNGKMTCRRVISKWHEHNGTDIKTIVILDEASSVVQAGTSFLISSDDLKQTKIAIGEADMVGLQLMQSVRPLSQ